MQLGCMRKPIQFQFLISVQFLISKNWSARAAAGGAQLNFNFQSQFQIQIHFQFQFKLQFSETAAKVNLLQLGCRRLIQYQIEIQLQFSISISVQFSESAAKVDLVQLGCRSCSRRGEAVQSPAPKVTSSLLNCHSLLMMMMKKMFEDFRHHHQHQVLALSMVVGKLKVLKAAGGRFALQSRCFPPSIC